MEFAARTASNAPDSRVESSRELHKTSTRGYESNFSRAMTQKLEFGSKHRMSQPDSAKETVAVAGPAPISTSFEEVLIRQYSMIRSISFLG